MICSSNSKPDKGLICDHAYTLIDAVKINNKVILKIRNPWGNSEVNFLYL